MRTLTVFSLIVVAATAWASPDCQFRAPRQAEVAAGGVAEVSIHAEAGSLKVIGVPGLSAIRARGTACASKESVLDDIRLTAIRRGNAARVEVDIPDFRSWKHTARLDLVVEVPTTVNLDVNDGSGDAEIEGVGTLRIDDGSGSLRVENVHGSLEIEDGSGDIELRNIEGDVQIDDGSGSIDARDIAGSVSIDDASGEINVRAVRNHVTIEDSSGGIEVFDVGGDFVIRSDSSGGVDYSEVRGRVKIPRD